MPMWSRRTAMLILTSLVLSVPNARGVQPVGPRAENAPVARPLASAPADLGAVDSSPLSLTPFTPWKMRRKAVLEETDTRIGQESDLGPACLPDRVSSLAQLGPIRSRLINRIPLRC
jgi:hypothetical protein